MSLQKILTLPYLTIKRISNSDSESLFSRGLCSSRDENGNYLHLLTSPNIGSASRDDVLREFIQMFEVSKILSLSEEEVELAQSRADRTFINSKFKVYFEYKSKNYSIKTLAAKHTLRTSKIKSIIVLFNKCIKRHLNRLQVAHRRRKKKATRAHIDIIQNFIEINLDKSILVFDVKRYMRTTNDNSAVFFFCKINNEKHFEVQLQGSRFDCKP